MPSKNDDESSEKFVPPEAAEPDALDDEKTSRAVEAIEREDSDNLLAAEDAKRSAAPEKSRPRRFFASKKVWIPALVIVILIILAALPWTRYRLLGLGLRQNFAVQIIDSQTGKPVSDADVRLAGDAALTNSQGRASLRVKVGDATLTVSKKYYKTLSLKALVGFRARTHGYKLQATGRQVPLKVVNKINGQPVNGATIIAAGTKAETGKGGKVTIVLPAAKTDVSAQVGAPGFNAASATIKIAAAGSADVLKITPTGRVYFLSNASGNINVVSTNLDGSGRQTVLAGTGNEDPGNTVMMASGDWKYLALLSKRDGGQYAKLFLINTSNDQLTVMDDSPANFTPVGWSGHYFIYQAASATVPVYKSGQTVLKSYDADTGQLVTLDQTTASGTATDYMAQNLDAVNLVGGRVLYAKAWNGNYGSSQSMAGKNDVIISVQPSGAAKQQLVAVPVANGASYTYVYSVAPKPAVVDLQLNTGAGSVYYVYQNGTVTQSNTLTSNTFSTTYPTYFASPSGSQTFWSEQRDGQNSLFVGDENAGNGRQIASSTDYVPYGWYTNSYLLVEKAGNTLYVMPSTGGPALKVADYYSPPQNF